MATRYHCLPHELMELDLNQFLFDVFVLQEIQSQNAKDNAMKEAKRKLSQMEGGNFGE